MDAAAAFLSVRPRSVAETRRRLRHLGYRHELVDSVVGRLVAIGYLDDAAFARAWVESRDRARPRGAAALRRELELKGVERSIIQQTLEERDGRDSRERPPDSGVEPDDFDRRETEGADAHVSPSADDRAAHRLLERRLPALLREADEKRRRQKAYALLAQSGFDPDTCAATIERVLGAKT